MSADLLLDTHTWGWSFYAPHRLSAVAISAIDEASNLFISPVCFYEMAQKARRGKWPEIEGRVEELPSIMLAQDVGLAELTPGISLTAGSLDWDHRDPFDRIIAATAIDRRLPVVTRDRALRSFPRIDCIW